MKGAPDVLLGRCDDYVTETGAAAAHGTLRQAILSRNQQFAQRALQVVAFAQRVLDPEPASFEPEVLEQRLCFLGLAAMKDPCALRQIGGRSLPVRGDRDGHDHRRS